MSRYKLYDSIQAAPQSSGNLRDLLNRASHIAKSSGPDVLQKIERDGELYLDSSELRWFVNEIEIRQRRYDAAFDEVLDRVVEEIKLHKG